MKQQQRAQLAADVAAYRGHVTECPGVDNDSSQVWIEHVKEQRGFNRARKRGMAALKRRSKAA